MFKKIVILTAICMLALAGSAFAAGSLPVASDSFNYNLSNKVSMTYYSDLTNYTMNAKHFAGNRVFSTSNQTTSIYYQESSNYLTKTVSEAGIEATTPGESTYTGWQIL